MYSDNLRGIFLILGSMVAFAVEDMFLKIAVFDMPVGHIVLISGIFGVPFFALMARRSGRSIFAPEALHPAVLMCGMGEMARSITYVTALASVPLPTVSVVLQAMPLVVTLAAALFLHERVGWRHRVAVALGR